MSSKFKTPRPKKPVDPATKKVKRGEIIAFMDHISTDENFCLRVWETVRGVLEREQARAIEGEAGSVPEDTGLGSDAEVATQTPAEPEPFSFAHIESVVAEAEAL